MGVCGHLPGYNTVCGASQTYATAVQTSLHAYMQTHRQQLLCTAPPPAACLRHSPSHLPCTGPACMWPQVHTAGKSVQTMCSTSSARLLYPYLHSIRVRMTNNYHLTSNEQLDSFKNHFVTGYGSLMAMQASKTTCIESHGSSQTFSCVALQITVHACPP